MWELVSYQSKYTLLFTSILKTFPKRLGLFGKIQKYKAFQITLWYWYFFLNYVISFLYIYQTFKTLKIYFSFLINVLLGAIWIRNIWGWRFLLQHCHEWIWFTSKHWENKSENDTGDSNKHSFWSFIFFLYGIPFPLGISVEKNHLNCLILTTTEPLLPHHQFMELCPWLIIPTGWEEKKKDSKRAGAYLLCQSQNW